MSGLIYFVQQDVTWAVKIGFTADMDTLEKRIRALQTASPYQLRLVHVWEGDALREHLLHRRFAAQRLMGEWFSPCERMAQFIASCKAWQARYAAITTGP